jgi:hypothetical protein
MVWTERLVSASACACERCRSDVASGHVDIQKSRHHAMYEFACRHFDVLRTRLHKLDHYLELFLIREGEGAAEDGFGIIPSGLVKDYSSLIEASQMNSIELSQCIGGAVIVTFPLHPKPHDSEAQSPWLQGNWTEEGLPMPHTAIDG